MYVLKPIILQNFVLQLTYDLSTPNTPNWRNVELVPSTIHLSPWLWISASLFLESYTIQSVLQGPQGCTDPFVVIPWSFSSFWYSRVSVNTYRWYTFLAHPFLHRSHKKTYIIGSNTYSFLSWELKNWSKVGLTNKFLFREQHKSNIFRDINNVFKLSIWVLVVVAVSMFVV